MTEDVLVPPFPQTPVRSERFVFDTDFVQQAAQQAEELRRAEEDAYRQSLEPKLTEADLQAAYQRGIEEGRAQGKAEALTTFREDLQAQTGRLLDCLTSLDAEKAVFQATLEARLTQTVRVLLQKLVGQALSENPADLTAHALAESAKHVNLSMPLTVSLHPATLLYVQENAKSFFQHASVTFQEDASLLTGDCRLSWHQGGVDFRLSRLTEEIDALLAGMAATSLTEAGIHPQMLEAAPPEPAPLSLHTAHTPPLPDAEDTPVSEPPSEEPPLPQEDV